MHIDPTRGSGGFFQNSDRNFELFVPAHDNYGLLEFFRDNNDPEAPWTGPHFHLVGKSIADLTAMQSTPGRVDIIARQGDCLYHSYRENNGFESYTLIGEQIAGKPTFVQSYGDFYSGNFELFVPSADGKQIKCWWRDNITKEWKLGSAPNPPGIIKAVAAVFSSPLHIELLSIVDGKLFHCWRDKNFIWSNPFELPALNSYESIAMVETSSGSLELVASLATGGIEYFTRADATSSWKSIQKFGDVLFDSLTLMESTLNGTTHLEIAARRQSDHAWIHYYRENKSWSSGVAIERTPDVWWCAYFEHKHMSGRRGGGQVTSKINRAISAPTFYRAKKLALDRIKEFSPNAKLKSLEKGDCRDPGLLIP